MSELDTLIIKLLETLITKYKLAELNRYEESYDYVMLEISLMNDIHHLMLGTYIFNSNATLKHLNVYLENKFGVNLNSDKKQAIRIIKLTNLNL
jgi:hypothetical protein